MKSIFTLIAMFMALNINAQTVEEVTLDLLTDYSAATKDYYLEFQDENYYLQLDINQVPATGKTFTMANSADDEYNAVRCKYEVITNKYNTKEWRKYYITDLNLQFSEVNTKSKIFKMVATIEAKSGDDIIKRKFIFNAPSTIDFTLSGTSKYDEDFDAYSFRANNGQDVKADYSFNLGVKSAAYKNGKITTSDLTTNGNSIKVSGKDDTKIKSVNLTVSMTTDDMVVLTGTVTDANNVNYNVNIKTNDPDKSTTDVYNVNFGGVLKITEDEGDIKFSAENNEFKFVGYITGSSIEVPSGSYTLSSFSKFGPYLSTYDFYMLDEIKEAKMDVVNNGESISITATFKQNGDKYNVTASTDQSTAISTVATNVAPTATFNLAGQRVADNTKGIIIKNGKKMLVK